jgi:diguanylate cyclase (GGDEF)-like protein/PAS domain S-box-containing protein
MLEATFRLTLTDGLPVISVSGGVQALLGFTPEEFLSSAVSLKDRVHPDDSDIAAALFSPEGQSQPSSFNIRLRHADGRIRCVRGQYTKEATANGGETVLEVLLQDARSLWKKASERPLPDLFRSMLENTDDFIFFKDRNYVMTGASRNMVTAFEKVLPGSGLLGLTDYEIFPEEIADKYHRLEKQVFAGMDVAHEVQDGLTVDGKKIWADNRKYPVKSSNGEIIGLFGIARDVTEQVNAAEALRQGEELLRESQRIAGVGSYILDIASGVWTSSEVLDEIFGIEASYLRTVDGWTAIIHPEDRAMMAAYFADEVVGRGMPFSKEYRIIRQNDKTVRWVNGLGHLELDAQGKPVKMHGTVRDVTERKLSQIALSESKELLELFINHSPAALAMFDTEMRHLAVSRRWLEVHCLDGQEVIGVSHYETLPYIPERWRDVHRRALAGETIRADEDRFEWPDGRVQWWRWEVLPWHKSSGAVGGIIIFTEDITKQKEADERLQLAANVFTHAREGIMITAPDGSILDVNETFTGITGYTREEVVGRNPRFLKSGLQGEGFYESMWRALVGEGQWSGEIWNRNKSGEIFAAMLTISSVLDAKSNVQQYVALFSDITLLKEHERRLEHIAHYDVLTGLPNRVLLADRLQQAMVQTRRRKLILAVAYLDLDGFKAVNDRHGHEAGDQLLAVLAARMRHALREGDTLARLGGDEFVAVLLDLADVEASVPVLTRLLDAAAEQADVGELILRVSASVGVTFYPQTEEVDEDQLLRQADQAMYQAKLAGRNRYQIFDATQDRTARGRHESLDHIRHALSAREFVLHYQPMVNMRTGAVVGAEALVRWQHPERGLVPPGMFLPVIEDHPLAIELGEWVIDTALAQMESWQAAGFDMPVSVNVGALQLQQEEFVDRLRALLAAHPLVKPSSLRLEVVETSALEDVILVSHVFDACRKIGVSFALDDFGTGYSSLTYLKRLPADVLKIDQSFVRDMLIDAENLTILEGVLGMALAFRRQVVAEGVETVDHGRMLLRLGCELGQGYGIARPVPACDLPAWSAAWRPDPRWMNVPVANQEGRALLHAGVEHWAWIEALEAFLRGLRPNPPQMNIKECKFGAWLNAERLADFGELPEFHAVEALHWQTHALAAELLELHAEGRSAESLARLNELHALRDALLGRLPELLPTGSFSGSGPASR